VSLSIRTDRSLIRAAASSTRYLLARVTAPAASRRQERLPVNIALVLDRSGSMGGERKFDLARQAVEHALRMLGPNDRFSVVVFDTEIEVLARSTRATATATRRALEALAAIGPRGGTDLCGGWMRGCEQIAEFLVEESVSRCLLLTDGQANHGITEPAILARHAAELRLRGVRTSTLGVGDDFDERLLRDMAHEGGGNFYFIEAAAQIPTIMTSELGEALEVTVRDAVITVTLPAGARAEPLNRFRVSRDADDGVLRIELGDLVSEQEVAAVIRVTFPRGARGDTSRVGVSLDGRGEWTDSAESTRAAFIEWTYAGHGDNDRQPRDVEVDREVATIFAARARAEATEANRNGDLREARRILERTAERIAEYAGADLEMQRLRAHLLDLLPQFTERMMDPRTMKESFYAAETSMKSRTINGTARRR